MELIANISVEFLRLSETISFTLQKVNEDNFLLYLYVKIIFCYIFMFKFRARVPFSEKYWRLINNRTKVFCLSLRI